VRVDRIKDMSVHVSTCTNYDFKALAPAKDGCAFLRLVTNMSDRFSGL